MLPTPALLLHAQTPQEGIEDSEAKCERPNVSRVCSYSCSDGGRIVPKILPINVRPHGFLFA